MKTIRPSDGTSAWSVGDHKGRRMSRGETGLCGVVVGAACQPPPPAFYPKKKNVRGEGAWDGRRGGSRAAPTRLCYP